MQNFGWAGHNRELLARAQEEAPGWIKRDFKLDGVTTVKRMALFEIARKVLGRDIANVPQPCGNCVGASTEREIEYLQCVQIALGNLAEYKDIWNPYHYGCGKVYIGGDSTHEDGSLGLWQSQALIKYGVLPLDTPGLPAYTTNSIRAWGANDGGVLDKNKTLGQTHLVGAAAKVTSADQAMDAVCNGYVVEVCSNQGFTMAANSEGFHTPQGEWNHSMSLIYVDYQGEGIPEHFGILNNWGDSPNVHGILTDLRDKSLTWPGGMLRVHAEVVDRMLAQGDSFAYSSFQDFQQLMLPPDFFSTF